jgi:hypothetical protein
MLSIRLDLVSYFISINYSKSFFSVSFDDNQAKLDEQINIFILLSLFF